MKQNKKRVHPVMLRLPEDVYNWLIAKADKERRTVNSLATVLFEKLKAAEDGTDSLVAVAQPDNLPD